CRKKNPKQHIQRPRLTHCPSPLFAPASMSANDLRAALRPTAQAPPAGNGDTPSLRTTGGEPNLTLAKGPVNLGMGGNQVNAFRTRIGQRAPTAACIVLPCM